MRPVYQANSYDCLSAALASILEVPLARVPKIFTSDGTLRKFGAADIDRFMFSRGFRLVWVNFASVRLEILDAPYVPFAATAGWDEYWVAAFSRHSLDRDDGGSHALVMHRDQVVHNPSGNRPGLCPFHHPAFGARLHPVRRWPWKKPPPVPRPDTT